jgi:sialate O-acetylesterase
MRMRGWLACAIAATSLLVPSARAAVKPHALISEGMVLQRDMKVPIWGTADEGEKVTVHFQGQEVSATAKDGKWLVHLENLKAGGPFEMTIQGKNKIHFKNVLVGEVWIASGQSNMEWPLSFTADADKTIAASANSMIRLFSVPKIPAATAQSNLTGNQFTKWFECGPQTVGNFSAVAYFFGRDLQKALNVPVGLIHTSWGGTPAESWTSKPSLEAEPSLKYYADHAGQAIKGYGKVVERYLTQLAENKDVLVKAAALGHDLPAPPANPARNAWTPTTLYNGMIAPLIPYGVKGAIWYQGESNAGKAYEYRTLLPAMIKDWRAHWGEGDFAFLIVQLAPFMKIVKEPVESDWAELREAQLRTALTLPKTGIAIITDVGEEFDIHPRKKGPVGARLALAARAIAYGEDIVYSGPIYTSMRAEGNKVILSFNHVGGGLVAKGGPLTGFTIAGEDAKFVNAQAELQDNKVVVWSSEVEHPVAVRYGWANYPTGNLWNKEDLPASPFRTDDFPMKTGPKKTAAASNSKPR